MIAPWTALAPIEVRAGELLLRESQPGDVAVLVGLFDTEQMDRRTPLASPFDAQAAARYVAVAGRRDARSALCSWRSPGTAGPTQPKQDRHVALHRNAPRHGHRRTPRTLRG